MANLFYIITIIISILVRESFQDSATIPAVGTDCLGNDFLCVDQTQFLICVEQGNRFQTVDQLTQTCSSQSYCDNKMNYECASSVPATDTPEVFINTVAPQANGTTDEITTESPPNVTDTVGVETTTDAETPEVVTETTSGSNLVEEPATTVSESNSTEQVTTVTEENITNTQEPESTTPVTEEVTNLTVNVTSPSAENTVVSGNSTAAQISTTVSGGVTEGTTSDGTNEITPSVPETSQAAGPSTWAIGTTTTPAPTTTTSPVVCKSSGFQPHPTDCHKFIICIKINRYYRVIDIPCLFNRAYDPKTKRCTADTANLCGKPTFECTAGGYFKDPYLPDKYYICLSIGNDNFRRWEFSCSSNQVYSALFKRCRQPDRDSGESNSDESKNSRENKSNDSRS